MERGYIKLWRKIVDSKDFLKIKVFNDFDAWIDILVTANHMKKITYFGDDEIVIEPGEFLTSQVKLADRWGWSLGKVNKFLHKKQSEKQIILKCESRFTKIVVNNWYMYQPKNESEMKAKRKQNESIMKQLKNDKNIFKDKYNKNIYNKNKYKPNNTHEDNNYKYIKGKGGKKRAVKPYGKRQLVELTDEEVKELKEQYGDKLFNKFIIKLETYIPNKSGTPYKDHYAVLQNWVIETVLKKEGLPSTYDIRNNKKSEHQQVQESLRKPTKEELEKFRKIKEKNLGK